MENTVLGSTTFAVTQALATREQPDTDFAELTQILYFDQAHLAKIEALMQYLGLARRTIINMAIKYAAEIAHQQCPDTPLAVRGLPRKVGEKPVRHEITAETRHLIETYELAKHINQFSILGINLLHSKLVPKPKKWKVGEPASYAT